MKRIPELLAPVGGLAQFFAAVNNGADAVYLGGSRFNARGKAENFNLPGLRDAVRYAHERNVKVYVTFNTLLKDRELADALEYAGCLWDVGADAVIVQDMGLARLLHRNLPELPLHLSTQGTVYNPQAVDLMKEFGFRRIVPARELTLEEIRAFASACHDTSEGRPFCEVEVFVHGALCMCYSGQCQMSRLLGASEGGRGSVRSGNRGLCAQPCRLPYTDDQGRTGYFLSPKDLCLIEDIPALAEAGVDSLKIEGRLKSPEYVAVVTGIYRKYLDEYAKTGTIRLRPEDREALTQIYSRGGFTRGYLYENPGEKLLSGQSPKNAGIYVGRVESIVTAKSAGKDKAAFRGAARKDAALIDVAVEKELDEGDGVEVRPSPRKKGRMDAAGPVFRTGGKEDGRNALAGKAAGGVVTFRKEIGRGLVRIGDIKGQISEGDGVYRVTKKSQIEQARQTFSGKTPEELDRQMARRIPLRMWFRAEAGKPAVLRIREAAGAGGNAGPVRSGGSEEARPAAAGKEVCVRSELPLEAARNHPAEAARISAQLARLGGTPFTADENQIDIDLDGICAVPISEINRMRRAGISLLLQEKGEIRRAPADMEKLDKAGQELAGAELKIPAPAEVTAQLGRLVPVEEFMAGESGMPVLPEISKGRTDAWLEGHFDEIAAAVKESGIIVNNPGWIRRFQDAGVKVYGGHGLNVYNDQARQAFEEIGVEIIEASYEADLPLDGKIPLMVTEHPVKSKTLTDRKGQVHRVETSPSGDKTIIW